MKECKNCGELMFTGRRSGVSFREWLLPYKRKCYNCGEMNKASGWFERGCL